MLVPADTSLLEIEAFGRPEDNNGMDLDVENEPVVTKTRAGRAKANGPSPPKTSARLPKYEFRIETRPSGVGCTELAVSGGQDLAGKFSLQPGEGTSTLEIGVKLLGSSEAEEVYRVFVTKAGM